MKSNFEQSNTWTGISEGGYVNHPDDPGGMTNHGVTVKVYASEVGKNWRDVTEEEMRNMTKSFAKKIFKKRYWDTCRCDKLPLGLDYAVFDYAINSGPAKAIKDLQRSLGVTVDGVIGSVTLGAIDSVNVPQLIISYCERRYSFVKGLKTFKTFGRGWTRRIMGEKLGAQKTDTGVIDRAWKQAKGVSNDRIPEPLPPTEDVPMASAPPEEPTVLDIIKKPEVISIVGTACTGIVGVVSESPILQYGFAGVMVIAAITGAFLVINHIKQMDPA